MWDLLTKTDRKAQTISFAYDALDRLTSKQFPDSTAVSYVYDALSRLTQAADPTGTYAFSYDNLGRLTGTTTNYSFLTGRTLTESYSYDAASNRVSFTDPEGGITNYTYDSLNRLTGCACSRGGIHERRGDLQAQIPLFQEAEIMSDLVIFLGWRFHQK